MMFLVIWSLLLLWTKYCSINLSSCGWFKQFGLLMMISYKVIKNICFSKVWLADCICYKTFSRKKVVLPTVMSPKAIAPAFLTLELSFLKSSWIVPTTSAFPDWSIRAPHSPYNRMFWICPASWFSETYFGTALAAFARSLTTFNIFLELIIAAANLAAALWLRAIKALKSPIEAYPITPLWAALARNSLIAVTLMEIGSFSFLAN